MIYEDALALFERIVTERPNNWSRILGGDLDFMRVVDDRCNDLGVPRDVPTRDRIYAAMKGGNPICPHGSRRTLAGIREGWKGCGRAGTCACARELVSQRIRDTKQRNKNATIVASQDALGNGEERLRSLLSTMPSKAVSQSAQRDPVIVKWVNERTASIETQTFAERVYLALHGSEAALCQRGQRMVFNTLEKGYRFCASDCECRREEQARKIAHHHASISLEERERRLRKQRETMQERYGADNAMDVPVIRERYVRNNIEKIGARFPFESGDIRAKAKETLLQRHGVTAPIHIPEAKKKQRATNIERHGAPTTMHIARAVFKEEHRGLSPFEVPEIATKAEQSMLERHGVTKPLLNPTILRRMQDGFEERQGVRNPMLVPEIKAKVEATVAERYGRTSPNQAHFSDASWAILQDKKTFSALFDGRSLREVAQTLGIAYDTARKWCDRHGIDLPRSTYEDAIADFLRGFGLEVESSNRKIIAPYEIDVALPERRVGIEFCGLYWHSEKHKRSRNYHLEKHERAAAAGWRLVTIFEDEWVTMRPVVETRLRHILGLAERGPGARHLTTSRIQAKVARTFLDRHHIQGGGAQGFACYGAFEHGKPEPVAVMTFASPRRILSARPTGAIELLRFATDGRSFAGVASRLFAAFQRDYNPDAVVSFADRRWSDGALYQSLGFRHISTSEPGYFYFHPNKGIERHHRAKFQRHKIANLIDNSDGLSEGAIMERLGYHRVWDCGTLGFMWTRPALRTG